MNKNKFSFIVAGIVAGLEWNLQFLTITYHTSELNSKTRFGAIAFSCKRSWFNLLLRAKSFSATPRENVWLTIPFPVIHASRPSARCSCHYRPQNEIRFEGRLAVPPTMTLQRRNISEFPLTDIGFWMVIANTRSNDDMEQDLNDLHVDLQLRNAINSNWHQWTFDIHADDDVRQEKRPIRLSIIF